MRGQELLAQINADNRLLQRFIRYVSVDTASSPESTSWPSTPGQLDLARTIVQELKALGISDAMVDEHGYVYASLAANYAEPAKVAFLAHLDVSFDCSNTGVKPVIHRGYKGGPLTLTGGVTIDPADNPHLADCLGDTIITSDGNTLLGADDKAGVVEIIEMLDFLQANPQIKRPKISICFTPDEEKGTGVDQINLARIGADFGFTVDGGFCGEINLENFDAFSSKVTFRGVNTHPGQAKNKMVNALRFAAKFIDLMPMQDSPEQTEKRQGFIHPTLVKGDTDEAVVSLLLRAFSLEDIERLKGIIVAAADQVKHSEPRVGTKVEFKESYRNMAIVMEQHPEIQRILDEAASRMDLKLSYQPIRGGTDGCRLSFMGLPCPNIFAGGLNFHSVREWVSLEKMVTTSAFLVSLVQCIAQAGKKTS